MSRDQRRGKVAHGPQPTMRDCPPGVNHKHWRRWRADQRRAALALYWSALPSATLHMLNMKCGGT